MLNKLYSSSGLRIPPEELEKSCCGEWHLVFFPVCVEWKIMDTWMDRWMIAYCLPLPNLQKLKCSVQAMIRRINSYNCPWMLNSIQFNCVRLWMVIKDSCPIWIFKNYFIEPCGEIAQEHFNLNRRRPRIKPPMLRLVDNMTSYGRPWWS